MFSAAPIALRDGDELQLLQHACSCLQQPYAHHRGDAAGRRSALHALLTLATRRSQRALRELPIWRLLQRHKSLVLN